MSAKRASVTSSLLCCVYLVSVDVAVTLCIWSTKLLYAGLVSTWMGDCLQACKPS